MKDELSGGIMLTIEQKKHVDAFEYWVKTNTENGVSILPESICKDIIAILREKDGEKHDG